MDVRSFKQRKTGFRVIKYHEPLYSVDCYLVIGAKNADDVQRFFATELGEYGGLEGANGEWGGLTVSADTGSAVAIFLPSFSSSDSYDVGNLFHEIFHLTHMALTNRGLANKDPEGAESHAYFAGLIVQKFWLAIKKLKL